MSVGSILHHTTMASCPNPVMIAIGAFRRRLLPALANQYLLLADFLKSLIEFAAGGWFSATQRS
ncbi:hypothetical protein OLZ32_00105 [Rhizobium sp. 1AS11]|uniref:hypothetical protein n=1 Tax=Rhizobium acaciae TaxID=2989736 RepID=UPI00221FA208|nr:hypothetical protein [Rhizobium acaciae]MCW1407369.1 hypothetical protein [Rhizobium acaciae]MCW1738806.1 hypothetical protein [Rhizobium acaciae]MCW1748087.1 hypothetical protein [Rhizobium acaciae]